MGKYYLNKIPDSDFYCKLKKVLDTYKVEYIDNLGVVYVDSTYYFNNLELMKNFGTKASNETCK
jgi:hypothetical protein